MMRMESKRQNPEGMSQGLKIALIITLILTVFSFGVRKWRQSSNENPATLQETGSKGIESANNSAPAKAEASIQGTATSAGLRPPALTASLNPMARRNAPVAPAEPPKSPDQPPPPPTSPPPPTQLEPPAFRLIGAHLDGKSWTAFFSHDKKVIAARPRAELPGGFELKTIDKDSVTVLRRSNREKIEMPLEMPK